tara:strand:- start:4813 stop:4974 length:162 start_codon:yes stop_codon:yes gene_type:complete
VKSNKYEYYVSLLIDFSKKNDTVIAASRLLLSNLSIELKVPELKPTRLSITFN